MRLHIAVLPGDGVGPEVTAEAVRVLRAVAELNDHSFTFAEHPVGAAAIEATGRPLPPETLAACRAADAVLLGAVGAPGCETLPPDQRPEAGLLELRRALGAFANLRPAAAHDAALDCSPLRPEVVAGADVLVVRELLGGLYYGHPRGVDATPEPTAVNTMRYSEGEIARVARVAFEAARRRRGLVTSVDKANVLETSQLWRAVVADVACEYLDVALEHIYVDACAMRLVTDPRRFDVVLTENLFGDVLSDEAAVIAGSLGMLGSASIGGAVGIFEPVHGSAPDLAGQGIANPLGAIASAAMLLRHAGLEREADDVEAAVSDTLAAGHRTADLNPTGPPCTTSEMGRHVADAVAEIVDMRHPYHAV
jgi:3-isopropylmalate dehydrogenase